MPRLRVGVDRKPSDARQLLDTRLAEARAAQIIRTTDQLFLDWHRMQAGAEEVDFALDGGPGESARRYATDSVVAELRAIFETFWRSPVRKKPPQIDTYRLEIYNNREVAMTVKDMTIAVDADGRPVRTRDSQGSDGFSPAWELRLWFGESGFVIEQIQIRKKDVGRR